MSWTIDIPDLIPLAVGAAILGTGGGGDPYIGRLMVEAAMQDRGPVRVLDVAEVPEDAWVLPSAGMGAPTVLFEKPPQGDEAVTAFQKIEGYLGVKAFATCPIEAGGVNSMVPLAVGARLGVPVVDADGMGRAFPELHMETFHIYGVKGTPACIANEHGDLVILDALHDNYALEWLARGVTIRMGGHAFLSHYPMQGKDLRRAAVRGTLALGLRLGRAVLHAQRRHEDPVAAVCDASEHAGYGRGENLFRGKIVEVSRRTADGFAKGSVAVQGMDQNAGSMLRIDFQNENLVAFRDGVVVCTVPDLIVILDQTSGTAVTTERLRYGQRVAVLGIPAPAIMKTSEALAVWGPGAFGYPLDYQPIA